MLAQDDSDEGPSDDEAKPDVDEESGNESDVSERERLRTRPNRKNMKSVYVGVIHCKDGSWEARITAQGQVGFSCGPVSISPKRLSLVPNEFWGWLSPAART